MGVFVTIRISLFKEFETARLAVFSVIYWLTGSRIQAQSLWHMGLVAPRHVGSSQTRARTSVPRIGRQTLNHCATREAPNLVFM